MEAWDHKTVKDKLNGLDTLPPGYAPKLSSKWELIETGLDDKKGKNRAVGRWRVAAAAIVLVCGSLVLWINNPAGQKGRAVAGAQNIPVEKVEIKQPVVASSGAEATVKQVYAKRTKPTKRVVKTNVSEPIDEVAEERAEIIMTQPVVAIVKQRKPRFTEIDFNEDPLARPTETVVASQQFRFRIGVGASSAASNGERDRGFRISTTF